MQSCRTPFSALGSRDLYSSKSVSVSPRLEGPLSKLIRRDFDFISRNSEVGSPAKLLNKFGFNVRLELVIIAYKSAI